MMNKDKFTVKKIDCKQTKVLWFSALLEPCNRAIIISAGALLVIFGWSYRQVMISLYQEWQKDPDSSVGLLVTLIALVMLWYDRKKLQKSSLSPDWILGVSLLVLSQLIRFAALFMLYQSVQRYTLLLTASGLILMICGRKVFISMLWILLFLFLMIPLPTKVENLIGAPLQSFATTASVFLLEAFGIEVAQEGNVIMLNETIPMGVAEACNGLRMLTAFIIVTAAITYFVKTSKPRKAVLLCSSIPIAVIGNILRLLLTAVIMLVNVEFGKQFFHDLAGLVMMPIAVLLLFAELKLMNKIFSHDIESRKLAIAVLRKKTRKRNTKSNAE